MRYHRGLGTQATTRLGGSRRTPQVTPQESCPRTTSSYRSGGRHRQPSLWHSHLSPSRGLFDWAVRPEQTEIEPSSELYNNFICKKCISGVGYHFSCDWRQVITPTNGNNCNYDHKQQPSASNSIKLSDFTYYPKIWVTMSLDWGCDTSKGEEDYNWLLWCCCSCYCRIWWCPQYDLEARMSLVC